MLIGFFFFFLFFFFVSRKDYVAVNVGLIQEWIDVGRLKPKEKDFITIRDLVTCGILTKVNDGVKLLAKVSLDFCWLLFESIRSRTLY